MNKALILVGTFLISVTLAMLLVYFLPGDYNLDETQNQVTQQHLDWTRSWDHPELPLSHLIAKNFKFSILLQGLSFLVVLLFSFLLSLAALKYSECTSILKKIMVMTIAAPPLLWIPLLVYFFSLKLDYFPLRFEPTLAGWALPLFALSLRPLFLSTEILLTEWQKVEFQSYFLVARSKGLSRFQVFFRHGLKNALVPYTTQMGNFLIQSLIGSVLVENLFSFPGMGLLFVHSLQNRDLPVILALTILFTLMIMIIHTAIEFIHRILEPRSDQVLL